MCSLSRSVNTMNASINHFPVFDLPAGTTSVVIRRAVPDDSLEVRRFVFEITRSYGFEPDPEGVDADVMHYGESNDVSIQQWVAEVNGVVVGSLALGSS